MNLAEFLFIYEIYLRRYDHRASGIVIPRKLLFKDYSHIKNLLLEKIPDEFKGNGKRILNVGGVNPLENIALSEVFNDCSITVVDHDNSTMDKYPGSLGNVNKKYSGSIYDFSADVPFDVVFMRHFPVDSNFDSGSGKQSCHDESLFRKLYGVSIEKTVLFATFYDEKEKDAFLKYSSENFEIIEAGMNPKSYQLTEKEFIWAGFLRSIIKVEQLDFKRDAYYALALAKK